MPLPAFLNDCVVWALSIPIQLTGWSYFRINYFSEIALFVENKVLERNFYNMRYTDLNIIHVTFTQ